MTGRGIDQILPHPCDPVIHERYTQSALGYVQIAEQRNGPIPRPVDPAYIWGDALGELARVQPAARIVNLETAVTRSEDWLGKGINYRMNPGNIACLRAARIDCCVLANNHVLDFGVAGLRESLRVLRKSGIRGVGAGLIEAHAYAPLSVRVNRHAIHIVNISEGEDLSASSGGPGVFGWDIPRAASIVRRLKARGGVVIAIAHCGLEYVPFPPPYVVSAFRALVDAGADCVVGHHPHVPQGMERWRGRPIFYSLGNFVFYQSTNLLHRKTGFCVSLWCAGGRVTGVHLHPYRITDIGLRSLDAGDRTAFNRTLARLSCPFKTAAGPARAWNAWLAYYGERGFRDEVLGILEKMTVEPRKGAAMFRNRITAMQHLELWRTYLTRVMTREKRGYSRGDFALVEEYFSRSVS